MAPNSSGNTNLELIENMIRNRRLVSERVASAMKKVDRAHYVLETGKDEAYFDAPQTIKYGATISAPHMHARASDILLPLLLPGAKVLDIGSGSGYTVAVFHQLVSSGTVGETHRRGKVVGVDHIPELVEWSIENLKRDGLGYAIENGEIEMVTGDGREGFAKAGPFDAIHVGAAATVIHDELVNQLARPGRMFIPVKGKSQDIWQVDKDAEGNVTKKKLTSVRYVPLTDRESQLRSGKYQ